jgi:hypothetical protein
MRFRDGAPSGFEVADARRIVLAAADVREVEPGVAELTTDGIADIHFGDDSPEIMFFVFAASPTVMRLIYDLAHELQMVVFFPSSDGWRAAVAAEGAARTLPDRSWSGWEDFDDDFYPSAVAFCRTAADLEAFLRVPYDEWDEWAHPPKE